MKSFNPSQGFSTHLANQNHSTPQRDSDNYLPMFTLATSDGEDETSSTDTQPPAVTAPISMTTVDSHARDTLPDVVEEEEVMVAEERNGGVCESKAPSMSPAFQMESNHHMESILAEATEALAKSAGNPKDSDAPLSNTYSLILLILLILITSILVVFVLFETDLPLVQPLQDLWLVEEIRVVLYEPSKAWTANRWHDFTDTFIAPASQYVTRQVDTIMTRFKN